MKRLSGHLLALVIAVGCATTPVPTPTASPSAAPTASPAPTPTPTPSPTAGLSVDPVLIRQHLDALQQIADANGGIRAAGTPGYEASADYVAQVMIDLGFQVQRQSFDFPFFDEADPASLTVGDQTWTAPEWVHAALYSASGDVSGVLERVGSGERTFGCDASEWTDFTAGHIAVVPSGMCFTRQKVELAQGAGAAAMISLVERWKANQILRPTLLDPAGISIPVIVAGIDPTQALWNADGATANVSVHGDNHTATVDNVLGTWPGAGDRVVMMGSHLDSVLDGPGINDNGSGVATLMSLAASVATQPLPAKTIRFGFWSAEEFGDLGSANYVDNLAPADQLLIDAYLNLDMVGSPIPGRYVYDNAGAPSGSSAITQLILDALQALDAPGLPTDLGANSDHFAFAQAGIPIGGVFSGLNLMSTSDADLFGGTAGAPQDLCYHLSCDTTDNVDRDSAALLGQAIAAALSKLAY
ncbi:MAG: M20/M25/M40 family metallo-hydrolase [Chloroflexota bacterium]